MEKIEFSTQLLDRYLNGTCSDKERAVVEGWYNKQLEQEASPLTEKYFDTIETEIWTKIKHKPMVRKFKLWQIASIAAACIIMVYMSSLMFFKTETNTLKPPLQTLAAQEKSNNLIQLPDGSMVVLQKGSKISYPKSFKVLKIREIYLVGKAFFDIKHLNNQPFIVHAGKVKTTVLGTAFDIIAEPGANEVIVRVVRGKVNVANEQGTIGDLTPNKKVTVSLKTELSTFSDVNAVKEMSWTKQDILLNNLEFSAICEHLEQRFNVKITIYGDELKLKRSTITLAADENLKDFIKTICEFNGAVFTFDEKNNQYNIRQDK